MPYFWALYDGMAEADMPLRGGWEAGRLAALGVPAGSGSDPSAASDQPHVLGRPLSPSLRLLSIEAGRDVSPWWALHAQQLGVKETPLPVSGFLTF